VILNKRSFLVLTPIFLFLALGFFYRFDIDKKIEIKVLGMKSAPQENRKPQDIDINGRKKVKYFQDYTIVLVGDSMTEKLGNSDELRMYLKKYYTDKTFEVLNYGFGSTNILSVQERLEKTTFHGRDFRPILDIAFDLILIESFGNNPLSEMPLDQGLKKQTEALDKIMEATRRENPKAKIAFVATIAPNRYSYGKKLVDLTPEKRAQWADERTQYIKNHIDYANAHQIPLINIYQKSLKGNEGGSLEYLSSDDYIHPSPNGVYFISEEIAKGIFEQKLLTL